MNTTTSTSHRTLEARLDLEGWLRAIPGCGSRPNRPGEPSDVSVALVGISVDPERPVSSAIAEHSLDEPSACVLIALLEAASNGEPVAELTLRQIQERLGATGHERFQIRQCLEVCSSLRLSGLLQSDRNPDQERRRYRIEPASLRELLGLGLEPVPESRTGVQALTDLSTRVSALVAALRREDPLVSWCDPVAGSWGAVGARARELKQLLKALRNEPVGQLFHAMTNDDPMREATLALLIVAGREGWGPQPWGFVSLVSTTVAGLDQFELAPTAWSSHVKLTDDENPLLYLTPEFIEVVGRGPLTSVPTRDSVAAVAAKSTSAPNTYRARRQKARLADLALPAGQIREIRLALDAQQTAPILRDWGFDDAARGRTAPVVVLLSGPPGTGKTFAAEAMAGELGKPLINVGLSAVLSKWVGESEARMTALFATARMKKAVLLLDEVDGLLAARGSGQHHDDRMVNLLLTELESTKGLVILTTNRADALDQALERRVTTHLVLERPGRVERLSLWRRFLPARAPLAECVNVEALADLALSGAEIRKACVHAARKAIARDGKQSVIRQEDLLAAAETTAGPRGSGCPRRSTFGFGRGSTGGDAH